MAAPFAALEARINTSAFAHLANATADFGSGVVVDGIFDTAYATAFDMSGTRPSFVLSSSVSVAENAAVTIRGKAYTVTDIHPEGEGMHRLILNEAN